MGQAFRFDPNEPTIQEFTLGPRLCCGQSPTQTLQSNPPPPMTGGDSSATLAPPPKRREEPNTTTTLSIRAGFPPAAVTGSFHRRRRQRRRKVRRVSPIHKLGDDLLLEVFLRLPSLATLVRASFTCRAWRCAVASSPDFRRRFRAIHPAPLLGLFFDAPGPAEDYNAPAFPTFIPSRRRDRDLTAAVRGGDFFLTCIEDLPDEAPSWEMVDCCRGSVLLWNWDFSSLVVFNPLSRQCEDVFDVGSDDMLDDHRGQYGNAIPRLVISAEDPMSFRVVILVYDKWRVRAVVFSSDNWEWSVYPWVDVPPSSGDDKWIQDAGGMQSNRHLYWVYNDQRYLVSLDTATIQFCVTELPRYLRFRGFDVGETKDGATCIVFSDHLNVGVLMPTRDNDGVERWVLDKVVPMDRELERALHVGLDDGSVVDDLVDNPSRLSVFAVRDGYVYLATLADDPQAPCWLLSLCLKTMSLERLFKNIFDDAAHPYIMAWPPSLVGNYGSFAVEDAPSP